MSWTDAAAVYRELSPAVLGYLRARGAEDPEDLLGEVFLQVTRDLPRFVGDEAALRRWVFSIAHNRLIDEARRRGRRARWLVREATPPPQLDAADPPDPQLVAALRALTSDQQEVVALRFVADLSIEDVARITGRSVGAVKALQHRALENLRRAVSPER